MASYLFTLADKLQDLRAEKTALEARAKEIGKVIQKTEAALHTEMLTENVDKFTRNGETFSPIKQLFISSRKEHKAALFAALRANGYDNMIIETIPAQKLIGFARDLRGDETEPSKWMPTWLDGLVSIYEKPSVNIRKE